MTPKTKEIKFTPRTEAHDLAFKLRHVRSFLTKGMSVKLTVSFRGREQAHPDLGFRLLDELIAQVSDIGKVMNKPRQDGRNVWALLTPSR